MSEHHFNLSLLIANITSNQLLLLANSPHFVLFFHNLVAVIADFPTRNLRRSHFVLLTASLQSLIGLKRLAIWSKIAAPPALLPGCAPNPYITLLNGQTRESQPADLRPAIRTRRYLCTCRRNGNCPRDPFHTPLAARQHPGMDFRD